MDFIIHILKFQMYQGGVINYSTQMLLGAIFVFLPLFSGCDRNKTNSDVSPEQFSERIQAIQNDPNLPAAQKEEMISSLRKESK